MTARISFVAHPDDDLIFMNPDIASDIQGGVPSWTCYLTAGNVQPGSAGYPYADERIKGLRAAYARAAKVANDWDWIPLQLAGRQVVTNQLKAAPHVNLVFTYIHAANGSDDGDLSRMWANPSFSAQPLNGAAFTKASLLATLRALIDHVNPLFLRLMDPQGQELGDHIDHRFAGRFTATANLDAGGRCVRRMDGYLGYLAQHAPENCSGYWQSESLAIWNAYKPFDSQVGPTSWDEMSKRQFRKHVWMTGDTYLDL
jgi:LmbE family N-acetylglucosaminyl deacetylase